MAALKAARRQSWIREKLLRFSIWLHNNAYHAISFFASYTGTHPKHDILQYHLFFVENVAPSDSVLDIGFGKGNVAYHISKKAALVDGIDISLQNVRYAQETYRRPNLHFFRGDAITYPFQKKYDAIILSNVLEHIEHRVAFLRRLSTIAPKILIRVPLLTRDWISVYKKQQGFEYRLDHTHFIEYDIQIFKQEMEQSGLDVVSLDTRYGELYAVTRASS